MNQYRSRNNQPIGKKEQIDILLHEYDSLRAEMLERHTVFTQSVGFAAIVIGGLSAILWEHWIFCLTVLVGASIIFYVAWRRVDLDTVGVALRVCELEKRINELAGEQLLVWESNWGVFSPDFPLRDKRVRAARKAMRDDLKSRSFPDDKAELVELRPKALPRRKWNLRGRVPHWLNSAISIARREYGVRAVPWLLGFFLLSTMIIVVVVDHAAPTSRSEGDRPWMNRQLSPDQRADLVVAQMTIDEKVQLTHGVLAQSILPWFPIIYRAPKRSLGGAGFVPGIERLGIPDIQIADAGSGVTVAGARTNGNSTILPSPLALTATWNPALASEYGTIIGRESHAAGFNMVLGGAVNLTREPRSGRTFENHGEDPFLAGMMVAPELKAIQDQHVISVIKHFAVNDQETGRFGLSSNLDTRSLRESDLLAFEIGIAESGVGAVMCAYNRVNGIYACENEYLLRETLKEEWNFKGWVISDWGATHSTERAAMAGLDQELPFDIHYGDALKQAVIEGSVPLARLNDMLHRILRTMFAVGVIDNPPRPGNPPDGTPIARRIEQEGAVLLRNSNGQLPLNAATVRSIAVIGSNADVGVLSGGGSSQIMPPGGSAAPAQSAVSPLYDPILLTAQKIWVPSSPLNAIRERAPKAIVRFNPGTDVAAASRLAAESDVVLLFANQWRCEGIDLPNLSLPDNQDALIEAVASANPHTVVILETGGAVLMPWLHKTNAVLQAWYPGIGGASAIADIIFGDVNPSGKLPISFPQNEVDVPHRLIAKPLTNSSFYDMMAKPFLFRLDPSPPKFDVDYSEGLRVGYKWFDAEGRTPLFPFGFGLSYTSFGYSDLHVSRTNGLRVTFAIANTGARPGAEVAQIYLGFPDHVGEPPRRLVGWQKVLLRPGEKRIVALEIEPKLLSEFNTRVGAWQIAPGNYQILVGSSSRDVRLTADLRLPMVE